MDLAVPKFKIDENYVGEPPKVEVAVENMKKDGEDSKTESLEKDDFM